MLARLIAMIYFPLQDTTEARYGEMARIMAETGDWITPYFDYDVPFWGKPPLVFWLEALSIKVFGLNDFAPRFPSWIMTIATAGILYIFLRKIRNTKTAMWGIVIYASTGLVFFLSGVVILDPIFTFTTTLAYVSFVMVFKNKESYWSYLFFIAIALGLLSKGPLILVLIGGSIGLWLLLSTKRWRVFKLYPWVSGTLLMLIITLPWYILAEMKTPGFIDYFIIGEHFQRFVDTGWEGDLYGVAHHAPRGKIWLFWLGVSLPWGIIAIAIYLKGLWKDRSFSRIVDDLRSEEYSFYLIWATFTMLFFTMSGNVLATYVLPALPALAVILALYFDTNSFFTNIKVRNGFTYTLLLLPLLLLIALLYANQHKEIIRTEKFLIAEYKNIAKSDEPLYYLYKRPFSARFYSQGKIKVLSYEEFQDLQERRTRQSYYLAVPKKRREVFEELYGHPADKLHSSLLYDLVKIDNRD